MPTAVFSVNQHFCSFGHSVKVGFQPQQQGGHVLTWLADLSEG